RLSVDAVRGQRWAALPLRLCSLGEQWAVDVQDGRRDGADPADANSGAVQYAVALHAVWQPLRPWLLHLNWPDATRLLPVSSISDVSAISSISDVSGPGVHHDLSAAPGMLEISVDP